MLVLLRLHIQGLARSITCLHAGSATDIGWNTDLHPQWRSNLSGQPADVSDFSGGHWVRRIFDNMMTFECCYTTRTIKPSFKKKLKDRIKRQYGLLISWSSRVYSNGIGVRENARIPTLVFMADKLTTSGRLAQYNLPTRPHYHLHLTIPTPFVFHW